MNVPAWLLGCSVVAGWGALAAVLLWLNRRDRRRDRRRAQEHRDVAFLAAHGIDWNATAPERTP